MNTPSHFLMTAAARKALPGLAIPRGAVWLGSVAPDVPLYALFAFGLLWFRTFRGMELESVWNLMWAPDGLYFNNPWWKGLHSCLHAPLVILAGLALARALKRTRPNAANWILWFFAACALHSIVDIFTHNDDGPLLLWPFHWSYRFSSPISYWDPDHYGSIFVVFEAILDLALIGYLGAPFVRNRIRSVSSSARP